MALKNVVGVVGPVSIAVDAASWMFYGSGVLDGDCGNDLDHGVLAVGYGSEEDSMYWRIKNSWGTQWGEDGFIRVKRMDSA